jgi:hypothetical protein
MVETLSMRTKLLMAVLSLIASVALMGVTADAANASGVTEIRDVQNFTPYFVYRLGPREQHVKADLP